MHFCRLCLLISSSSLSFSFLPLLDISSACTRTSLSLSCIIFHGIMTVWAYAMGDGCHSFSGQDGIFIIASSLITAHAWRAPHAHSSPLIIIIIRHALGAHIFHHSYLFHIIIMKLYNSYHISLDRFSFYGTPFIFIFYIISSYLLYL